MRDRARPRSDEPRGRQAREEQAHRSARALEEAKSLFSLGRGGAKGEKLAAEMRAAHGSEGLAEACRAYLTGVGMPDDLALLSLFLDSAEHDLIVGALEALLEAKSSRSLEIRAGLRSQLRVLAQDRDDTVAGISEELLEG